MHALLVAAVVPVASLGSTSAESNAVRRVCFAGDPTKEGEVGGGGDAEITVKAFHRSFYWTQLARYRLHALLVAAVVPTVP